MHPNISALLERKQSIERHPLVARAGRDAAELWLIAAPLSMADFRDLRFRNLTAGNSFLDDYAERRNAFNVAFEKRIALAIAQQSRGEVVHG